MFPLHAILDVDAAARGGWEPAALARIFFETGAQLLQLRAKRLGSGRLLELADDVVWLARRHTATIIVNDRIDVARLSGASGVHVGQTDLAPSAARRLLGPDAIVGYSTHDVDQIAAARLDPISYVAVGPVFGTNTKNTGYAPVGIELVREAARLAQGLPVVAIGGITLQTAPAVMDAGAASVAVISDLLAGGDPAGRVAAYLRVLGVC